MRKYKYLTAFLLVLLAALLFTYSCSITDPGQTSDPSASAAASSTGGTSSSQIGTSGSPVITLPEDEDTVVSILACGDNLIHPSVYYYAMECYAKAHNETCTYAATNDANYDFFPIYENVAEAMKSADICYINQETLSGGPGTQISGFPQFNCPEAVGRTLKELGVDIVNLAHNHMLDSGDDRFLVHSNSFFNSIGLTPIGFYENEADTQNIVLYESKGIKFAFLAYTYSTNGLTCSSQTYIPYFDEALIRRQVALAKQQADVILVSAHWGDEDSYTPNATQKRYASLFCELGVAAVIGMHPHCLQPMEWMTSDNGNRMLLTYSLGNFVSGQQWANEILEGMLSFQVRKDAKTGAITVEEPILTPLIMHSTKEAVVARNDTGYRNFKIYRLSDYTEELAAKNSAHWYEAKDPTHRLYGSGEFSIQNLCKTVERLIPEEFLPADYKNRFGS